MGSEAKLAVEVAELVLRDLQRRQDPLVAREQLAKTRQVLVDRLTMRVQDGKRDPLWLRVDALKATFQLARGLKLPPARLTS